MEWFYSALAVFVSLAAFVSCSNDLTLLGGGSGGGGGHGGGHGGGVFGPGEYDNRTGYPAHVAVTAGAQVISLAQTFGASQGVIADLGAGTGQIGLQIVNHTVRSTKAVNFSYIGLDSSPEMISQLKARLDGFVSDERHRMLSSGHPASVQALLFDLNSAYLEWPLANNSVRLFFAARAAHWFHPVRAAREVWRSVVADDGRGAWFVTARVQRAGPHDRVRAKLWEIMWAHGLSPKDGEAEEAVLFENIISQAPKDLLLSPRRMQASVVATWNAWQSPMDNVQSWRSKQGLGGVPDIDAALKETIILELEAWINTTWPNQTEFPKLYASHLRFDGVELLVPHGDSSSPQPHRSVVPLLVTAAFVVVVVTAVLVWRCLRPSCMKTSNDPVLVPSDEQSEMEPLGVAGDSEVTIDTE